MVNLHNKIAEYELQMKQMEVEYQRLLGAIAALKSILAEATSEQHSEPSQPAQEG